MYVYIICIDIYINKTYLLIQRMTTAVKYLSQILKLTDATLKNYIGSRSVFYIGKATLIYCIHNREHIYNENR